MASTGNYYALIMAGGGGTRLWPMSRRDRPKQVLPLVGEHTMFELAVQRLDPLFPPERILVVTVASMAGMLREQAPNLPPENFVVEPEGRNTAPAIGLAALHIAALDPQAVMVVLTADHYIVDTARFRDVLAAAREVAAEGHVVTLGIQPTHASTGLGYIERGDATGKVGEFDVYEAASFREKPSLDVAEEYFASGRYSWNSGMFVWQVKRLMAEFQRQQPAIHAALTQIGDALRDGTYEPVLAELWPTVERISVDYAIMEGAQDVRVFPVDIGWNDVGSWAALLEVNAVDAEGNVALGSEHLALDTRNTLVASERLVATIGLDDILIIDTQDALLVCKRERAQDVRQVVDILMKNKKDQYL